MANEVTIIVKSKDRTDAKIGEKFKTSLKKSVEDGLDDVDKTATERFREIGDHSGEEMVKSIDPHLTKWGDGLDEEIDVKVKEKFRVVGEHGGESLATGLRGSLTKFKSLGSEAGSNTATSFGKSLGDAAGVIKGAWIPLLIAALLPELPAIGGLAATAVVLAFGAGLAGLGLVAAFHLKSVQKEFKSFGKFASGFMKDIGKPFAETWSTIFNVFGNVLKRFQPILKGAFKDFVAPAVTSFVTRLGEAFSKLEPAIVPVSNAFRQLMGSIGDRLPDIFDGIAKALTSMSNTIAGNPDLFAGFITGLLQVVVYGLKVIDFLSKLFDAFSRFTHTSNPFTLMAAALSPILTILLHLGVAGKVFHAIGDAVKTVAPRIEDMFGKIKEKAGPILDKIGNQIKTELVPAFVDFMHSVAPLAGKLAGIFTPTVVGTISDILELVSDLVDILSGNLEVAAGIFSGNWSKMWTGIKEIAKGGAKIAKTALESILNISTFGHGDKVIKFTVTAVNKVGHVVADALRDAAGFAKRAYRAQLTAVNRVAGPVKSAASAALGFARRGYRAQLTAISRVAGPVKTAISACLGFAKRAYRAQLTAVNRVASALRAAISLGNQWARRVFSATFNVVKSINPFGAAGMIAGGLASGGAARGMASGGPGGTVALVGEQGAELVRLPTGSTVVPHGNTMNELARRVGGGNQGVTLQVVGGGQDEFTKVMVYLLRNFVRITKGSGPNSVQSALGG